MPRPHQIPKRKLANPIKLSQHDQLSLLIQEGVALHQQAKFKDAQAIYEKVLTIQVNHFDALQLLGTLFTQTKQYIKAVVFLTKALEINPRHEIAYANRGVALKELKRFDEAIASFDKAIDINPSYAEAHSHRGNVLLELKQFDEAVVSFDRAIGIKPSYAEAHSNRGYALCELKQFDKALVSCDKAISINPNFAEAHSNRGNALTGLERFNEALESCDKAIIIKPDYAKAHNNLGITLQELGRLDEAVASCSKAIAINPDLADVHNNLGSMLQKLGRLEEAVASYSKAIAIKPDLAEAHINLGFTLQELGRLDDATASLSQALLVKADYASFKSATSVTALLPFGRSGSLFLHSLLDGHPDIATLPGVYFKGWFGINCWQYFAPDTTRSDWRERLVAKVIDKFIPLFNANNRQNVPGKPFSNTPWLAKSSGFMEMGSERSQPFVVDQNAFAATLLTMLNTHHSIDIKGCFELIHRAFEVAIRNNTGKASQLDGNIFYHIHNPDLFESAHFFHHYPQARLLYLMRHPIQSLESWMLTDYPVGRDAVTSDTSNDFNDKVWLSSWDGMVNKAVNMFMQVRLNANCWPNSRGVKLEDVKRDAKKVMPQLAEWMGVADHPALYESSFCGLQYWGPSAKETGNITGFDTKAIDRPVGKLFGSKDITVLETLFWPLSRLYGYTTDDEHSFRRRLAEIRPWLDMPLEYEITMYSKLSDHSRKLDDLPHYQRLHRTLKLMWEVLDRDGTYANMVQPLRFD